MIGGGRPLAPVVVADLEDAEEGAGEGAGDEALFDHTKESANRAVREKPSVVDDDGVWERADYAREHHEEETIRCA